MCDRALAPEAPSIALTAISWTCCFASASCLSRAEICVALCASVSSKVFTRNSARRFSVSASFLSTTICCSSLTSASIRPRKVAASVSFRSLAGNSSTSLFNRTSSWLLAGLHLCLNSLLNREPPVRLPTSVHHRLRRLAFPMRTRSALGLWSEAGSPRFRRDPFARDVALDPGGVAFDHENSLRFRD